MKAFIEYFSDKDIIFYLCKLRAKIAKQRNKKHLIHLLTNSEKYNYHKKDSLSEYEINLQVDLDILLPKRRKWCDLGRESRYRTYPQQKLNTIDKNIYSLQKTIKYYRKNKPEELFVQNLNLFIKEIQESVQDPNYHVSSPTIYPKPKKNKKELGVDERNICRPISLFNLKDRIILSFTNKFLTQLFDNYFEGCSYAFRAVQKIGDEKEIITHHKTIQRIIRYKKNYANTALWVSECDMKKFYDTVNHNIVKEHFNILIKQAKDDNEGLDVRYPAKIFESFLDCYCFNENVIKFNNDIKYWSSCKIMNGEFGWVKKDLESKGYLNKKNPSRIGIPQGGALSGLIANIVLDYADKKVIGDSKLLYIRFCDDMILMHPSKKICKSSIKRYKNALVDLKLIPHIFTKKLKNKRKVLQNKLYKMSLAPFWKQKSKSPYKWDSFNNGGFPWIGFVGYEINFQGLIRVRKSSLKKELEKQHKVVREIYSATNNGKRVSDRKIRESAIHRLIGMSVGRVELWNYSEIDNDMCWKNGFTEINKNKFSIKQLKLLDRTRNKLYYGLIKNLKIRTEGEINDNSEKDKRKTRNIIDYNKPFSYYYQILERGREDGKAVDDDFTLEKSQYFDDNISKNKLNIPCFLISSIKRIIDYLRLIIKKIILIIRKGDN
jgi:hypothetical protein